MSRDPYADLPQLPWFELTSDGIADRPGAGSPAAQRHLRARRRGPVSAVVVDAGLPMRPRASPSRRMTRTHPRRAASGTGRSSTCPRGVTALAAGAGEESGDALPRRFLPASQRRRPGAVSRRRSTAGSPDSHHYHFVVRRRRRPIAGHRRGCIRGVARVQTCSRARSPARGDRPRLRPLDHRRQRRLTISSTQPAMHGHVGAAPVPAVRSWPRGR